MGITTDSTSDFLPKISDIVETTVTTITTTSTPIAGAVDQQGFIITNLGNGRIHYSFDGTATSANAFIRRGEQLTAENYSGNVSIIAASGVISYQIDLAKRTT